MPTKRPEPPGSLVFPEMRWPRAKLVPFRGAVTAWVVAKLIPPGGIRTGVRTGHANLGTREALGSPVPADGEIVAKR